MSVFGFTVQVAPGASVAVSATLLGAATTLYADQALAHSLGTSVTVSSTTTLFVSAAGTYLVTLNGNVQTAVVGASSSPTLLVPGTPNSTAAAMQPGNGNTPGANLWSGNGAPASGLGSNGDFYFRNDTPGSSNQRIYVKAGGAWSGVV